MNQDASIASNSHTWFVACARFDDVGCCKSFAVRVAIVGNGSKSRDKPLGAVNWTATKTKAITHVHVCRYALSLTSCKHELGLRIQKMRVWRTKIAVGGIVPIIHAGKLVCSSKPLRSLSNSAHERPATVLRGVTFHYWNQQQFLRDWAIKFANQSYGKRQGCGCRH